MGEQGLRLNIKEGGGRMDGGDDPAGTDLVCCTVRGVNPIMPFECIASVSHQRRGEWATFANSQRIYPFFYICILPMSKQ